jgi:predicted dienelactone hydrolase
MGVAASLQLWRASEDHVLPHPFYAEAVRAALPTQPDYRVAQGADHFDFLPPCSDRAKAVMGLLCASPPGFDRAAFHAEFNKAVVDFFRRRLGE